MGISAGGNRNGVRSELNVTPLVDVVLVLLIIFMVSMPILLKHITVEVPRKLDANEVSATSSQIVLLGKADGTVDIDDGTGARAVNRTDLAKSLRPMIDAIKTERVVFVDFEDELQYNEVVSIMDTVKGLGKDASGNEPNPVKVALKVRETGAGIPAR